VDIPFLDSLNNQTILLKSAIMLIKIRFLKKSRERIKLK